LKVNPGLSLSLAFSCWWPVGHCITTRWTRRMTSRY